MNGVHLAPVHAAGAIASGAPEPDPALEMFRLRSNLLQRIRNFLFSLLACKYILVLTLH